MTETADAPSALGRVFTAAEQQALRELWPVYEANLGAINAETVKAAQDDPDLRKVLARQTPEQAASDQARSAARVRQAFVDGDWEPFVADLKTQGATYAQQGLPYGAWIVILRAAQAGMLRQVNRAYASDPQRLDTVVGAVSKFLLDVALGTIGETYLRTREHLIQQQQEAIKELSTPVLPLRPGLLLLPIVGVIDTQRARQLTEQLLEGIRAHRAQVVVLDLTGVPAVDSAVANHLLQTVRAAGLLGAGAIVTGLSTTNALTLTRIGVDLRGLHTCSDLQRGIEEASRLLTSPNGSGDRLQVET